MNRRSFLALASIGLVPEMLRAEHHVISADPLEVEFDLHSLRGPYTPVEDFYVRDHHDVPRDTSPGTLRIEGEVAETRELTLADLASLPQRELGAVLECAGNKVGPAGLVSNGLWAGSSLADVLSLVRPGAQAAHLHLLGRDGYQRSVPLERAQSVGILVTRLNGQPLTRSHGAPWRALVPGCFAMDSVKWLERVVLAREPLPPEGNAYQRIIRTPSGDIEKKPLSSLLIKSVITDPLEGSVLPQGPTEARGLAWSAAGKIAAVEVSPDGGGTWQKAEVEPSRDYEWSMWRATLNLTQPGAVELVARAQDADGSQQPAERDPARLDGYANNWYHRVRCVVA